MLSDDNRPRNWHQRSTTGAFANTEIVSRLMSESNFVVVVFVDFHLILIVCCYVYSTMYVMAI